MRPGEDGTSGMHHYGSAGVRHFDWVWGMGYTPGYGVWDNRNSIGTGLDELGEATFERKRGRRE